jgi:AcrR family transcriptional regulator
MRNARLTRQEGKALTRGRLVAAARHVFLQRGFHAASLDEIALHARVTKGAIYASFAGKSELFLAVLDAHIEERLRVLATATFPEEGLEAVARRHARATLAQGPQGVRWVSLMAEAWTHAAGDLELRSALAERQDRLQQGVAALVSKIGAAVGVTFALPPREMARAASAVIRGLMLERLLGPGRVSDAQFEATFAAFICGLARPAGDQK